MHSDLHFSVCRREIKLITGIFMGLQDLLPLKQPQNEDFCTQTPIPELSQRNQRKPRCKSHQESTFPWKSPPDQNPSLENFPTSAQFYPLGFFLLTKNRRFGGKKCDFWNFFFSVSSDVQFLWSLRDGNRNKYLWWEGRGFGLGKRKKKNNFIPDFFYCMRSAG